MKMIWKLLRKNVSVSQLIGFTLANIVGLTIVIVGLQIYDDVFTIMSDEKSFVKQDFIIVNKRVHTSDLLGENTKSFTEKEISDLKSQSWVREVGKFRSADYQLFASVGRGEHSMSTYMFFESIPDEFVDVKNVDWDYTPGDKYVPIIISKDYLSLYNFGFASSVGLPQLSESMLETIPLTLRISGNGHNVMLTGRVVGYSNRLNTILVPDDFMKWSNEIYGDKQNSGRVSRLIIDVSSPGDVKIAEYMNEHGYEIAGEKGNAGAAYFLNIITGVIVGIGLVIMILSFGILFLSISLLLQKNKEKNHSLIMLGYDVSVVARPYHIIVVIVNVAAYIVAVISMNIFRNCYLLPLQEMGGGAETTMKACLIGLAVTVAVVIVNIIGVQNKVRKAFYS